MKSNRPKFRKPKSPPTYPTPEELFAKLPNRARTHGYLRGPQVDVLRDYHKVREKSDIAFELPTGTGKTTVGLIISEWRKRQSSGKVAYIALTNQLASQVLDEARKLGIECSDLTGPKQDRDVSEVGRYTTGRAIGVTTYANIFNINPVIQASNVFVFDDAHGGEHYVSAMWTVCIDRVGHPNTYKEVLTAIRPTLSESQYRVVTDESQFAAVELADFHGNKNVHIALSAILDNVTDPTQRFPWNLIRNNLGACLLLVSFREITIRPLVPPTHTHSPYADTEQRIYMSATLGGEGDLLRGYGITQVETVRARHAQWGRRYIFMPNLHFKEGESHLIISSIWNRMGVRRALILAPSFSVAERAFNQLKEGMNPKPNRLSASDIEDSLDPFTSRENVVLSLAGRYDGVDLPGDNCRLLILAESPGAIGALERHLRDHWKLGPLLRRRERTRLTQGMGRCTRDATDFAVIIFLGQSLIDSLTPSELAKRLPVEIQRELIWGMEQGNVAEGDPSAFTEMIVGLLTDEEYRKGANEIIEEMPNPEQILDDLGEVKAGRSEVIFLRALWSGDYSTAYQTAHDATAETKNPALDGYRAWWMFLSSIAAHSKGDTEGEVDCLRRAKAVRINPGFIDNLLRLRTNTEKKPDPTDAIVLQAEAIWNRIGEWGWHGPAFQGKIDEMKSGLLVPSDSTKFHIGLERLGQCIGAESIRSTKPGAPDVVWVFYDRCFTLEAKSGQRLSKKDLQQANGHVEWVLAQRQDLRSENIQPLIVGASNEMEEVAKPHINRLNYISIDDIISFAETVIIEIQKIRAEFSGKEYATVRKGFEAALRQAKIDQDAVDKLLSNPLS